MVTKIIGTSRKEDQNITKTKRKKLEKLNKYLKKLVSERFDEYLGLFALPSGPSNYYENVWLNVIKMTNLTNYNNSNIYDEEVNLSDYFSDRLYNAVSLEGNRFKANFVSPNVTNLSRRNVLSKGLKFVPTSKHFNKTLLKEELESVGRKFRFKSFLVMMNASFTLILLNKSQVQSWKKWCCYWILFKSIVIWQRRKEMPYIV